MGKGPALVRHRRSSQTPTASFSSSVAAQDMPRTRQSAENRGTSRRQTSRINERRAYLQEKQEHEKEANAIEAGVVLLDRILASLRSRLSSIRLRTDDAGSTSPKRDFDSTETLTMLSEIIDERSRPSLEFALGALGVEQLPDGLQDRQRISGAHAFLTALRSRELQRKYDNQERQKELVVIKGNVFKDIDHAGKAIDTKTMLGPEERKEEFDISSVATGEVGHEKGVYEQPVLNSEGTRLLKNVANNNVVQSDMGKKCASVENISHEQDNDKNKKPSTLTEELGSSCEKSCSQLKSQHARLQPVLDTAITLPSMSKDPEGSTARLGEKGGDDSNDSVKSVGKDSVMSDDQLNEKDEGDSEVITDDKPNGISEVRAVRAKAKDADVNNLEAAREHSLVDKVSNCFVPLTKNHNSGPEKANLETEDRTIIALSGDGQGELKAGNGTDSQKKGPTSFQSNSWKADDVESLPPREEDKTMRSVITLSRNGDDASGATDQQRHDACKFKLPTTNTQPEKMKPEPSEPNSTCRNDDEKANADLKPNDDVKLKLLDQELDSDTNQTQAVNKNPGHSSENLKDMLRQRSTTEGKTEKNSKTPLRSTAEEQVNKGDKKPIYDEPALEKNDGLPGQNLHLLVSSNTSELKLSNPTKTPFPPREIFVQRSRSSPKKPVLQNPTKSSTASSSMNLAPLPDGGTTGVSGQMGCKRHVEESGVLQRRKQEKDGPKIASKSTDIVEKGQQVAAKAPEAHQLGFTDACNSIIDDNSVQPFRINKVAKYGEANTRKHLVGAPLKSKERIQGVTSSKRSLAEKEGLITANREGSVNQNKLATGSISNETVVSTPLLETHSVPLGEQYQSEGLKSDTGPNAPKTLSGSLPHSTNSPKPTLSPHQLSLDDNKKSFQKEKSSALRSDHTPKQSDRLKSEKYAPSQSNLPTPGKVPSVENTKFVGKDRASSVENGLTQSCITELASLPGAELKQRLTANKSPTRQGGKPPLFLQQGNGPPSRSSDDLTHSRLSQKHLSQGRNMSMAAVPSPRTSPSHGDLTNDDENVKNEPKDSTSYQALVVQQRDKNSSTETKSLVTVCPPSKNQISHTTGSIGKARRSNSFKESKTKFTNEKPRAHRAASQVFNLKLFAASDREGDDQSEEKTTADRQASLTNTRQIDTEVKPLALGKFKSSGGSNPYENEAYAEPSTTKKTEMKVEDLLKSTEIPTSATREKQPSTSRLNELAIEGKQSVSKTLHSPSCLNTEREFPLKPPFGHKDHLKGEVSRPLYPIPPSAPILKSHKVPLKLKGSSVKPVGVSNKKDSVSDMQARKEVSETKAPNKLAGSKEFVMSRSITKPASAHIREALEVSSSQAETRPAIPKRLVGLSPDSTSKPRSISTELEIGKEENEYAASKKNTSKSLVSSKKVEKPIRISTAAANANSNVAKSALSIKSEDDFVKKMETQRTTVAAAVTDIVNVESMPKLPNRVAENEKKNSTGSTGNADIKKSTEVPNARLQKRKVPLNEKCTPVESSKRTSSLQMGSKTSASSDIRQRKEKRAPVVLPGLKKETLIGKSSKPTDVSDHHQPRSKQLSTESSGHTMHSGFRMTGNGSSIPKQLASSEHGQQGNSTSSSRRGSLDIISPERIVQRISESSKKTEVSKEYIIEQKTASQICRPDNFPVVSARGGSEGGIAKQKKGSHEKMRTESNNNDENIPASGKATDNPKNTTIDKPVREDKYFAPTASNPGVKTDDMKSLMETSFNSKNLSQAQSISHLPIDECEPLKIPKRYQESILPEKGVSGKTERYNTGPTAEAKIDQRLALVQQADNKKTGIQKITAVTKKKDQIKPTDERFKEKKLRVRSESSKERGNTSHELTMIRLKTNEHDNSTTKGKPYGPTLKPGLSVVKKKLNDDNEKQKTVHKTRDMLDVLEESEADDDEVAAYLSDKVSLATKSGESFAGRASGKLVRDSDQSHLNKMEKKSRKFIKSKPQQSEIINPGDISEDERMKPFKHKEPKSEKYETKTAKQKRKEANNRSSTAFKASVVKDYSEAKDDSDVIIDDMEKEKLDEKELELEAIFGDNETLSKDDSELNPIGQGVANDRQIEDNNSKVETADSGIIRDSDEEDQGGNEEHPSQKEDEGRVEFQRQIASANSKSGRGQRTRARRRLRRESTNLRDAWAVVPGNVLFSDDALMQDCVEVWASVNQAKISIPFREPVLSKDAPNYFDIVKSPMDLSTVRKDLESKKIDNPRKFYDRMMLICRNALLYNDVESDIYSLAIELKQMIRKSAKPVVRKWLIRRREQGKTTSSESSLSSSSSEEEHIVEQITSQRKRVRDTDHKSDESDVGIDDDEEVEDIRVRGNTFKRGARGGNPRRQAGSGKRGGRGKRRQSVPGRIEDEDRESVVGDNLPSSVNRRRGRGRRGGRGGRRNPSTLSLPPVSHSGGANSSDLLLQSTEVIIPSSTNNPLRKAKRSRIELNAGGSAATVDEEDDDGENDEEITSRKRRRIANRRSRKSQK